MFFNYVSMNYSCINVLFIMGYFILLKLYYWIIELFSLIVTNIRLVHTLEKSHTMDKQISCFICLFILLRISKCQYTTSKMLTLYRQNFMLRKITLFFYRAIYFCFILLQFQSHNSLFILIVSIM